MDCSVSLEKQGAIDLKPVDAPAKNTSRLAATTLDQVLRPTTSYGEEKKDAAGDATGADGAGEQRYAHPCR